MTPEQARDYWLENLRHAERSVEVARRELLKAESDMAALAIAETQQSIQGDLI